MSDSSFLSDRWAAPLLHRAYNSAGNRVALPKGGMRIDFVGAISVFVADQVHEPDPQPWGTYAMIEDSEGNRLMLVQLPTG